MNLGRSRRIETSKVQRFLKKSKATPKIGHRLDSPRSAQSFEYCCVALFLGQFQKIIQRPRHLVGTHLRLADISPKVFRGAFAHHCFEASSRGCLNISQCRNVTPIHRMTNGPAQLLSACPVFPLDQFSQQDGTMDIDFCFIVQLPDRTVQLSIEFRLRICRKSSRRSEDKSGEQTDNDGSYLHKALNRAGILYSKTLKNQFIAT